MSVFVVHYTAKKRIGGVLLMAVLRLKVVDNDDIPVDCGVESINDMMKSSFYKVLCKQGLAYNIMLDDKIVGNCLMQFSTIQTEDEDYYADETIFTAVEIRYIGIDVSYQRRGIGSSVVKALISIAEAISSKLPVRFLILESFLDKVDWYKSFGFTEYYRDSNSKHLNTSSMRLDFLDSSAVELYSDTI